MKKFVIISIIACAALGLIFTGCGKDNGGDKTGNQPHIQKGKSEGADSTKAPDSYGKKAVKPVEFVKFHASETGTMAFSDEIEMTKTEDGVYLVHYMEYFYREGYEDEPREIIREIYGDEAMYNELCEILGGYEVEKWDGYHKTNSNVLDGSSISLEIELSDGSTISASGSNMAPKGYYPLIEGLLYMLDHEMVSEPVYENAYFKAELPKSWIGKVEMKYYADGVVFSILDKEGKYIGYLAFNYDYYGYRSEYNDMAFDVGTLEKDGENTIYLSIRSVYNLDSYVNDAAEEAVPVVENYSDDIEYLMSHIEGSNGWEFKPAN